MSSAPKTFVGKSTFSPFCVNLDISDIPRRSVDGADCIFTLGRCVDVVTDFPKDGHKPPLFKTFDPPGNSNFRPVHVFPAVFCHGCDFVKRRSAGTLNLFMNCLVVVVATVVVVGGRLVIGTAGLKNCCRPAPFEYCGPEYVRVAGFRARFICSNANLVSSLIDK